MHPAKPLAMSLEEARFETSSELFLKLCSLPATCCRYLWTSYGATDGLGVLDVYCAQESCSRLNYQQAMYLAARAIGHRVIWHCWAKHGGQSLLFPGRLPTYVKGSSAQRGRVHWLFLLRGHLPSTHGEKRRVTVSTKAHVPIETVQNRMLD